VVITFTLAMVVLYHEPGPLAPALQSVWLNVHVTAAAVALGAVTVGMVGCAVQLNAQRGDRTDRASTADAIARSAFAFAFPVWTSAVATGAVWAERAWGRYWAGTPRKSGRS
jgi:ABC-type transport system involved in cytochrome c biogenesis permease subunit